MASPVPANGGSFKSFKEAIQHPIQSLQYHPAEGIITLIAIGSLPLLGGALAMTVIGTRQSQVGLSLGLSLTGGIGAACIFPVALMTTLWSIKDIHHLFICEGYNCRSKSRC